ncbi:hypothetical protein GCM10020000_30990 [Streptomyces olivoverticillatus]
MGNETESISIVGDVPSRTDSPLRIAVLADSDTRWKWGALTARRLAPGGPLDGFLLRGRATPTVRQLGEVGIRADSLREVTGTDFLRTVGRARYDVVVLACVGGAVQAMLHGLAHAWRAEARRPVVVTGYVGVVYEKLADGLLLRHGADVVLANSRHDAERFRAVYAGAGAPHDSVTECALPFLGGARYEPGVQGRPYAVVFAAQPSVPETRADRQYLLERAVRHARLHPEREVLIKLRSKPGEHTTHIEELPYQKLAARLTGGLPPNCRLSYGHMGGRARFHRPAGHRQLHCRPRSPAPGHPHRRPHRPRHPRAPRQPPLPRLRLPHLLGPARRGPAARPGPRLDRPAGRRRGRHVRKGLRCRP